MPSTRSLALLFEVSCIVQRAVSSLRTCLLVSTITQDQLGSGVGRETIPRELLDVIYTLPSCVRGGGRIQLLFRWRLDSLPGRLERFYVVQEGNSQLEYILTVDADDIPLQLDLSSQPNFDVGSEVAQLIDLKG